MNNTRLIWMVLVLGFLTASCKQQKKLTPAEARLQAMSRETARLQWNLKTGLEDYDKVGSKNPAWDDDAKEALSLFATIRTKQEAGDKTPELVSILGKLHESNCNDPFINYLYLRYVYGMPSTEEAAKLFAEVAQRLTSSGYSPTRKFYAALRAGEVAKFVNGKTLDSFYPMRGYATQFLKEMLQDKTLPVDEAYDAARDFISASFWDNPADEMKDAIEPMFANWPDESVTYLIRGQLEVSLAWLGRGGGFAQDVSKDQWNIFNEHCDKAEKALEKAWSLDNKDTRIPTQMIEVAICKSYPKEKMDVWFNRAMKTWPSNYEACQAKARYLLPQWYGSNEDRLAFGRECVATNYEGRVPLILVDIHQEISNDLPDEATRRAYWKDPSVWNDIKSSFEKFFELNPDAVGWRHNYAWYANQCEQWASVMEQVRQFGSDTNYAYFGGKDAFEKMVKRAEAKAK